MSARIAGGEGLPPSAPETVALVIGWFALGFAFYSVAYAALGALVSRQEDLEATTAPVNVLLIAAFSVRMPRSRTRTGRGRRSRRSCRRCRR